MKTDLVIGILVCDWPRQDVVDEIGGYDIAFDRFLHRATDSYNDESKDMDSVTIKNVIFDCTRGELPADASQFDAFIMTGSKYSAYDPDEWIKKLIGFVAATVQDLPTTKWLGVCFGQQILAQALGGKVEKNPEGWEAGWAYAAFTEEGSSILRTSKPHFALQYSHQDHVSLLPPGFKILASNSICPVEAMCKDDKILAVQGHPEFTPNVLRCILKYRHSIGIFTDEFYNKSLSTIDKPLDSLWMGRKFIGFLVGNILEE
ncbi:hypothetical protein SmJEL517_g05854 [Synchytrium microbalum]|uniref:Glutamine amidotransferase domain-containing protein n=1 Tax=Synchytrium microbalum TaxID=1806994 RepID=A0A507BZ47_9FUNG|nr:uncharacterized protein SmJEL517_g05854 [Synchytrium microbalum]TPX30625.1 hypothetical protein SmJEL517_g05854 [Synchytrium microbalum]